MDANQDVSKSIDLEEVPVGGVEPKTSDGESRIIFEVTESFRITNFD